MVAATRFFRQPQIPLQLPPLAFAGDAAVPVGAAVRPVVDVPATQQIVLKKIKNGDIDQRINQAPQKENFSTSTLPSNYLIIFCFHCSLFRTFAKNFSEDDRKEEIEFYYSIMCVLDRGGGEICTPDNARFLLMLKSNFVVMLYNLIEACIIGGILEIYSLVKTSGCNYNQIISELQNLWSDNKISKIYASAGGKSAYQKAAKEIINDVLSNQVIALGKECIPASGNLDAKKIKEICDMHRIRYVVTDDKGSLLTVKSRRNSLSHGDESFSNCSRDLTVTDFGRIKDEVIASIHCILNGMKNYYDNKQYLTSP